MDFQNFYNAQQSANNLNQKEQEAGEELEEQQKEAADNATAKFNAKRDKIIDFSSSFTDQNARDQEPGSQSTCNTHFTPTETSARCLVQQT